MKPIIVNAVQSLTTQPFGWDGGEDCIIWPDTNTDEPPTREAIDAKLTELIRAWDAQDFARKRQAEYPSIQECVHAILDDDLTALQEKRQAVKTKYPKG